MSLWVEPSVCLWLWLAVEALAVVEVAVAGRAVTDGGVASKREEHDDDGERQRTKPKRPSEARKIISGPDQVNNRQVRSCVRGSTGCAFLFLMKRRTDKLTWYEVGVGI